MIDGKTAILGVFGNPIEHTKSPAIHNAVLEDCGINAVYLPLPVHSLEDAVAGFRAMNFTGANVTIPFKEKIIPFLDEISPVSKATGSVNTIYWKTSPLSLCGTSTDGLGALRNLQKNGVSLEGKRVALLGSGGAAKALAYAFLNGNGSELKGAKSLSVFYGKREELSGVLENYPNAMPLAEIENHIGEFDIICNATPLGMHPNVGGSPIRKEFLRPNLTIFDIVYNPLETQLLKDAKDAGCKAVGGIGMLIYQALESFKLWFPEAKPSDSVIANLIRDLGNI